MGPCRDVRPALHFGVISADSRCDPRHAARNHSNIGDVVQSLAAAQWLPASRVARIDRDDGSLALPRPAPTVVWFNAWWGLPWSRGPPDESIVPILTGMHMSATFATQLRGSHEMQAWLRKHGPVGARDRGTARLLAALKIPVWFSGCPTSLLRRPAHLPPPAEDSRAAPVLLIDVPAIKRVPKAIAARATRLYQDTKGCNDDAYELTKRRLDELATAGLVITTRLHVASPAIAMGSRVVFVTTGALAGGGGGRLEGMDRFFWTDDDADKLPSWYDVPRGAKNATAWEAMKARLLEETARVIRHAHTRLAQSKPTGSPAPRRAVEAAECALTPMQWPAIGTPDRKKAVARLTRDGATVVAKQTSAWSRLRDAASRLLKPKATKGRGAASSAPASERR